MPIERGREPVKINAFDEQGNPIRAEIPDYLNTPLKDLLSPSYSSERVKFAEDYLGKTLVATMANGIYDFPYGDWLIAKDLDRFGTEGIAQYTRLVLARTALAEAKEKEEQNQWNDVQGVESVIKGIEAAVGNKELCKRAEQMANHIGYGFGMSKKSPLAAVV